MNDILKEMWTRKYTYKEIMGQLSKLEKEPIELLKLIKEYQPKYWFKGFFGEEVAKFKLIDHLDKFYNKNEDIDLILSEEDIDKLNKM